MGERCRFCNKTVNEENCQNIFNNKQKNPPIWKIVKMLTNLTISENDPYTKISCTDCIDILILFYHYRENVLQTNRLIIDTKINNNKSNLNVYNKWPTITRDNNGKYLVINDHLNEQSTDISLYLDESDGEEQKIDVNNFDLKQDSEELHENSACISRLDYEHSFLKEELDIEDSYLKIDNKMDDDPKIYQTGQDSNILIGDENFNDVAVTYNDMNINNDNDYDDSCLDITKDKSDVEEFTSSIVTDFNDDQEMTKDNLSSNKSADDKNDNDNDNNRDINSEKHNNKGKDNRYHLESTNNVCQKKRKSNRLRKLANYSEQLSYQCDFCDKVFRFKSDLTIHLWSHTDDEKAYEKQMKNKQQIKEHSLCNERNSKQRYSNRCNVCGKKLSNKYTLKRHLIIHTGETPYHCHLCEKKFSRTDLLKVHLLRH